MKTIALLWFLAYEPTGYDLFIQIEQGERVFAHSYDSKRDCDVHARSFRREARKFKQILELESVTVTCERQQ